MKHLLSLLVSTASLSIASTTAYITAKLPAGTITGTTCQRAPKAVAFRGIPYAEPPVGNLRFAPPVPYNHSFEYGHLDATANPPSCIQFGEAFKETGPTSEDCLYLNIYAPANATPNSALPVRVWLYGGSNTDGGVANPLYDGCNVATHDAIMVSVNYRLGALGFLTLRDAGLHGNQALKDQILALQWVQQNIESFGGDPKKVMLHGQSAGARDAFTLATLPQAPELFSSAIFESGAGRESTTCANAQKIGEAYSRSLNCSISDASCLRATPVKDLVSHFETLSILQEGLGSFPGLSSSSIYSISSGPSVDGHFIKEQPSDVGVRVPSVMGYASQDGALFVATTPAFPSPLAISEANYTSFLRQSFGEQGAPAIQQHIPFSSFNGTGAPGFAAIEYVFTASEYQCPAYRALNKAAEKGVDAWAYAFNHTPSCPWSPGLTEKALQLLGPTHTSEIPFVLGQTRHLPAPNGTCDFSPAEVALSDFMLQAWSDMAARQAPASHSLWPRFTGRNASMGLTFNSRPQPGPIDFRICELFDKIRDAQMRGAGNTSCGTSATFDRAGNSLSQR